MISGMKRDMTSPLGGRTEAPITMTVLGRQLLWAIVCAPLVTGCYNYQSAGIPALQPGLDVRIELNDLGADALDRMVGRRVASLTGRVRLIEGDSIAFVLPDVLTMTDGSTQVGWQREFAVPVRGMRQIDQRVFQKSQTRKAIAAGVFLFSAVVYFTLKMAGNRTPGTVAAPGAGVPE
jgi:hypothetical protein